MENKLKYLVLIFAMASFNSWGIEDDGPCANNCSDTIILNRAYVDAPNEEGMRNLYILGMNFPLCTEFLNVYFAGREIEISASNPTQILAQLPSDLYKTGANKILVEKIGCPASRSSTIDLTVERGDEGISRDDFTTRASAPVDIFPFSFVDVEVNCLEDEKAISGGFKYSTWEVRTVRSYPVGTKWVFRAYNNSKATSLGNEFFAECVK